ncbi:uncharacterized protein L3040_003753 [Drepanopeziza brunnea f. sp. 'multigermtubi']|uniref:Polynucleotide 5'-hydroxyl-kinase GRC3 n=1 Tax=Marssonina brunnea f. sp. multigermtubi (strain MB_m1) TaxID=1072389 RepID=K1WRK5_MARBU|nr:RNA processing protein [Drepanopeziza brunnea f. sp. 'multigermtubi' MB_m1]EKD15047.1 RNA processing protein [Drepanopeziza brunnea f. sp. 'multigermtubi' MB_m1]KAJ5046510.1 hypothetical protein L3040_003753 [Drepanopeziza brunnea f. sp. 'multigermtubi']
MSANKKRKVDTSPKKPQLSAFAARQALKNKTGSPSTPAKQILASIPTFTAASTDLKVSSSEHANTQTAVEDTGPQTALGNAADGINLDLNEGVQLATSSAISLECIDLHTELDKNFESRAKSPDILPEKPSVPLSSYRPSKSNTRDVGGGTLRLRLAPGERLVIVGQYELRVRKGQVTFMGAALQPSDTFHRVFAASSHSLPVIRCSMNDVIPAEILLRGCHGGLDVLEPLSPLFGRLWHAHGGPLGENYPDLLPKFNRTTFRILFSTKLDLQSSYLQPLISPPEWNQLLSKLSEPVEKNRVVMICGPKSSGKSTFAKILGNRLLSISENSTSRGIAVLDIDPGQPEYSPPGQLALVHVQNPNFGPPFSHPLPAGKSTLIRAHSVASISPSSDPSLYLSCALDLFSHYRKMGSAVRNCPLIINTPGWVFGTGLEILVDLIGRVKPTEVIYMSLEGPWEVVSTLKDSAKQSTFFTLPSQISEYTTRTAAHLRSMQAISYFHLASADSNELLWRGQPLTAIPPWEIRYTGESPGIIGVMCYGEQPPPELLAETINGSLVAVVVIEDLAAIPKPKDGHEEDVDGAFDAELQVPKHFPESRRIEEPDIISTPVEQIPYFNPANVITLDPRYSHSIGLALVRGIDVARRRIQLLTPIAPRVIAEINETGKKIVLVSGKLDTPGWAYTEEMNVKIASEKAARRQLDDRDDEDEVLELDDEGEGDEDQGMGEGRIVRPEQNRGTSQFHDVPWVERLDGSQGRGVGSRVWRVRRDLGRVGDGGD